MKRLFACAGIACMAVMTACSNAGDSRGLAGLLSASGLANGIPGDMAPPDFSVDSGTFEEPVTVALSASDPSAMIRFTLDGSDPSGETGQDYSAPVKITIPATLKAVACREGSECSEVSDREYIILEKYTIEKKVGFYGHRFFNYPNGIDYDLKGNVYVADEMNSRVMKFDAGGRFLKSWGNSPLEMQNHQEGNAIHGLCVDRVYNRVYVVSSHVINIFDTEGNYLGELGELDWGFGSYAVAVAVDSKGNVYVADTSRCYIQIFNRTGSHVGRYRFDTEEPMQWVLSIVLAMDPADCLYVGNPYRGYVRKYSAAGKLLNDWSVGVNSPRGIAVTGTRMYITGSDHTVRVLDMEGNETGRWGSLGSGKGQFHFPKGIIAMNGYGDGNSAQCPSQENVYVVDSYNNRVQKFSSRGTFLLGWGDHEAQPYVFKGSSHIAVGPGGNVFVSDSLIHRVQEFTADGVFVRQWGTDILSGGTFTLGGPRGIAADASGVYLTDSNCIHRHDTQGEFLLTWGNYGNGSGQLYWPNAMTAGKDDRVYVVDTNNYRVQYFSRTGSFLGQFGARGTGDGYFASPGDISADSKGNIYVTDQENRNIQKFGPDGTFQMKWTPPDDYLIKGNAGRPGAVAVDGNDFVYVNVSRPLGGDMLEKYDSSGKFIQRWNYRMPNAMGYITDIGFGPDRSLYVSDSENHCLVIIRRD